MDLACNCLKCVLGFQPEIKARLWWLKHQILATRPVVSDKGPGPSALQKKTSMNMESSEANKVFIKIQREFACNAEHTGDMAWIPGWERSPGVGMATHFSIPPGKIPWTEEPGGLQSMGWQRVGHS